MFIIDTLKDTLGNIVYPKTRTDAIYDSEGNRLDSTLTRLDKSLTWNLGGSASGTSNITLPSDFKEIRLVTTNSNGNGCFTKTIRREELISTTRQFYDGFFITSSNNANVGWNASLTTISLNTYQWGSSNITNTATTTVYYRS